LRVYFTDIDGNSLSPKKIASRRKGLCKSWWNHQWLSRVISVMEWLTNGRSPCTILATHDGDFRIASEPVFLNVPCGIDEGKLNPVEEEDETAPIDEDTDTFHVESDQDDGAHEDGE